MKVLYKPTSKGPPLLFEFKSWKSVPKGIFVTRQENIELKKGDVLVLNLKVPKKLRSAIIIDGKPKLLKQDFKRVVLPKRIFVENYEFIIHNNGYYKGVMILQSHFPIYIPVFLIRILSNEELKAILEFINQKTTTFDLTFLKNLNIKIEKQAEISDGIALLLRDEIYGLTYGVLLDYKGRIQESNVCIENQSLFSLIEFVLIVRNSAKNQRLVFYDLREYLWGRCLL
ncbi:MAG: hypothetical protein Q6351_001895 [Candidatus Njordarchaeum guaymaensis]